MFDISARLVSEQDEIFGLETIGWENHSWKYMSSIGDERVINLQRTKVYVFSDSVLCLGKIFENTQSNDAWEQRLGWFKSSPEYRNFDRIDGEPMEFEWNIFPGFNTLQLSQEVKSLLLRLNETLHGKIDWRGRTAGPVVRGHSSSSFVPGVIKTNTPLNDDDPTQKEFLLQRYGERIEKLSQQDPGCFFYWSWSEKKWYSISEDSPQGEWDDMAEKMMLEFAESGHPIFRATSPWSRGRLKSKGHGKLSIRCCADLETNETIFRTIFL